ncbi:hypothetical protein FRB97_001630 [Tulasnella sp. 331]|nr:hypothetical protein FRB97_001630 [Tulasnella sp. 331]KAG8881991.1 hypothetical protein FRB98_004024 [Tulasnella sp. 332]
MPSSKTARLEPPLLLEDLYPELRRSDAALGMAFSPRANTLAVHAQVFREQPPTKGQGISQFRIPTLANQDSIWLAKLGATPPSSAQLFSDAYVTWVALGSYADEQQHLDSSQNIEDLNRFIDMYLENTQAHIGRLALEEPFDENNYEHWLSVHTSIQLFQTMLTSPSGMTTGLVGEEMLLWLNMNFVAVTKEEVKGFAGKQEPWLEAGFWKLLVRATIRCLSEGAARFIKMLSSHSSLTLRQIAPHLQRALSSHPRSTSFNTEQEFYTAHRRWRGTVRGLREQLNVRDENDGRGEWREGLEDLVGVLEGDKDAVLKVCDEDYGGYGWREAVSVWGIWVDVEVKRADLPDVLSVVNAQLPISDDLEEMLQASLISQLLKRFVLRSAEFDLWFGAHVADLLAKMGFKIYSIPISPTAQLEPGGDLAEDERLSEIDEDGRPRMTLRDHLVMDFAERILHSDPGFWGLEFDYLSTCGLEGRARLGAVLQRLPFDVSVEPSSSAPSRNKLNGILGSVASSDGLDDLMDEGEEGSRAANLGKLTGMKRVQALVDACNEYQLEDEFRELCKVGVVSRRLIEERRYGEAIAYSKVGEDYKTVARIADLLLNEYIERGVEVFLALVEDVPGIADRTPDQADPFYFNAVGEPTVYGARLSFLSGYAQFHALFRDGKKREAAHALVVMLNKGIVPQWWWGVVLLDAAGMCEDEELWFAEEDAYDLLRRVEEIYIRSEQGSGSDYLGALEKIMKVSRSKESAGRQGSTSTTEAPPQALKQLEVVRLSLARYLARIFTAKVT